METVLFKVLGGGAFGDQDVEVVDDEAGLVEGLGLAHVVVEARARLHLDHVDQVVKALVRMAPTHHFAVLVPVVEHTENHLDLVVEVAVRRDPYLVRQQIITAAHVLRGVHWVEGLARSGWESRGLPGLVHQTSIEQGLLRSLRVQVLLAADETWRWREPLGLLRA